MKTALRMSKSALCRLLAVALLLPFAALPLAAQEETSGPLPTSAAADFLGSWVIRITSPQGEFDADLIIRSVGDNVVASVALGPLGDHEVEDIVQTEDGIELRFEADFGGQSFAAALLHRWLPGGGIKRGEFTALNPRRADHRPGSFRINIATGRWLDFATGDKGGDVVSLAAYLSGTDQAEAARALSDMLGVRSHG